MVVVHTTEIYIPLKLNQSPLNVGITITLPPFTPKQVQDLALRYGLQDAIAAYKLESMGLVQLNRNQACVMCELYRLYFSQQLAKHSEC